VLLIAQMMGQFGMHRTLHKRRRQLFQQPLLADQILWSLVIR
jgi:hypothetical protein